MIESGVTQATLNALTKMGHVLQVHPDYTSQMGRGQAVLHDSKTGVNFGCFGSARGRSGDSGAAEFLRQFDRTLI